MVFSNITNSELLPNSLPALVISLANVSHVEIAIESFYGRKLGFFEFIPAGDVLVWKNAFSGK